MKTVKFNVEKNENESTTTYFLEIILDSIQFQAENYAIRWFFLNLVQV